MKRRTKIAIAFLAGVGVALALAYALTASGFAAARGLTVPLAVLHPFLRVRVPGNGDLFAASIVFNGFYYAAAAAIATRPGRGFVHVAATVALIAAAWLTLQLLFSMGLWLLKGQMVHS